MAAGQTDWQRCLPGARWARARCLVLCCRAPQQALLRYAQDHALDWIEDPSNQDVTFDRNYLRQQVMPLLRQRWPALAQTLSRSAQRSGGASRTLLTLARDDLTAARSAAPDPGTGNHRLEIQALRDLPRERIFNVLRLWVRQRRKPMPRLQDLVHVLRDLIRAGDDSVGLVKVQGYAFRRHSRHLHLVDSVAAVPDYSHEWAAPFEPAGRVRGRSDTDAREGAAAGVGAAGKQVP